MLVLPPQNMFGLLAALNPMAYGIIKARRAAIWSAGGMNLLQSSFDTSFTGDSASVRFKCEF